MGDFGGQFPTPNAAGPAAPNDALPVRPAAADARTIVCVLGGPGSGKTSQCTTAAAALGYTHLCVGQLLKAEQQDGAPDCDEIAKCMAAGTLVPTATVLRVVRRHLEKSEGPVLLDGFPRVAEQVEEVEKLGDLKGVLFLDCAESVLIERMDKTDCDDPTALIAQFTDHCLPVVDTYENAGKVQVIDASASIEDVQSSLQSKIRSLSSGEAATEAAVETAATVEPAAEPAAVEPASRWW